MLLTIKMRRQGFTIIEILLAITIIALGATLAGLAVYRNMDRTAMAGSVRRLRYVAQYARMLAAQHHRQCKLHLDLDDGSYWLTAHQSGIPLGPEGQPPEPIEAEIVTSVYARPSKLPEKLRFTQVRVGSEKIRYRGRVAICFKVDGTADPAYVQVSSADETMTVLIYPWTAKAVLRSGAVSELPCDMIDLDKWPTAPAFK